MRKSLIDALLKPILPNVPEWLGPTFAGIVVAILCATAWAMLN